MKKFISFCLTLVLSFSIVSIVAFGGYSIPENSKSCTIDTSQAFSYSSSVIGKNKEYGGRNFSTSKHKLTVCAQYFDASSNSWKYDKKTAVKIDSYIMSCETSKLDEAVSWRVYLKPYASYSSGCSGSGYIWHT